MECKAKEPTGHLPTSFPGVGPGELGEDTCNCDVLIAGRFVALPLDPPAGAVALVVVDGNERIGDRQKGRSAFPAN